MLFIGGFALGFFFGLLALSLVSMQREWRCDSCKDEEST